MEVFRMDFLLDIIIPKAEVHNTSLREQFVLWGGETFAYDPPRYVTPSNLFFEGVNDFEYYSRLLKKRLEAERYIALCIRSNALKELEFIINNNPKGLKNNDLICFFAELIALSEFYVFLLREDEGIKQSYVVKNKNEIITTLYKSMQWSNPNDILITK